MSNMTLQEVANALVENCKNGNEAEGLKTLYADDAVSVEAVAMGEDGSAEVVGVDAIRGKHEWWSSAMEEHSNSVDGPFCHGDDRFGVIFEMDATNNETKERMTHKELAIYTVANGKIVREEFFYTL